MDSFYLYLIAAGMILFSIIMRRAESKGSPNPKGNELYEEVKESLNRLDISFSWDKDGDIVLTYQSHKYVIEVIKNAVVKISSIWPCNIADRKAVLEVANYIHLHLNSVRMNCLEDCIVFTIEVFVYPVVNYQTKLILSLDTIEEAIRISQIEVSITNEEPAILPHSEIIASQPGKQSNGNNPVVSESPSIGFNSHLYREKKKQK